MKRLEALLQQLCPDGVIYKRLGDIATITRGGNFQKKDYREHGFPCIHYGQIYTKYNLFVTEPISHISEEKAAQQKKAKPGDIIMAVTSENIEDVCKCIAWLGNREIAVSGHAAIIHHRLNPKFLAYFLSSSLFYKQKLTMAQGTKVIEVSPEKLKNILLPVPPLEVQQEIVRILDHFTELTAELTTELTAELAAREKQHQYYTQHLYDSIKEKGVPVVCVKDVCDLLTGFPFDSSHFVSGGIHLLRGMNIKRGFLDYSDGNNRYWNTVKGYEKFLLADDDIVIAMDGSLVGKSYGQVKKQHLPVLLVQRVTRVRATKINAHYLYHYISSGAFTKYVEQKKTGGAVPHISMKDIENFTLPLPPEKLQEEISEVLDRFDALCNDLTSGLPAEIAARQKQYEYYRDKLLTFKERV